MRKKYFFFDIDGTLTVNDPVTHKSTVPASTRRTLEKLKENGHFVSIATGRAHWMAMEVVDMVNIDNLVTDGGNGIVLNGELVELLPLDHAKAAALCNQIHDMGRGVGVALHDDHRLYCKNDRFAKANPFFASFIDYIIDENLDFDKEKYIYKIFLGISQDEEKNFPILETMPHMRYHPNNLMIEPSDKYSGIERVMNYLGAPLEDVIVFGDGWNDVDMFSKAPFSIAMGNAVDKLQEMADFVTKAVDEDGIEYACRHFGWI